MSFCRAICNPAALTPLTQKPFSLTPGDSPTLRFEIINPDESPFNLSDYNIDFYVQRSVQDPLTAAEFHGASGAGVALGAEPRDGLVDVTIPAQLTAGLRLHRPYPWFLRINHTIQLARIYVPARGTFLLALPAT